MYNNEHNVMNKVLWIICWLLFSYGVSGWASSTSDILKKRDKKEQTLILAPKIEPYG